MVKISNEKLVNSVATLNTLSQQQLPIAISYAVSKNIAKIEEELKIYNAERQKLIDKYSVKGEDGKSIVSEEGNITIDKELVELWNSDIAELFAIENEFDVYKISIIKLESTNFNIAPSELMKIDYMIVE